MRVLFGFVPLSLLLSVPLGNAATSLLGVFSKGEALRNDAVNSSFLTKEIPHSLRTAYNGGQSVQDSAFPQALSIVMFLLLITIGVVSLALSYYASYRHIQCDAPLGTWCYAAGLYNIISSVALVIVDDFFPETQTIFHEQLMRLKKGSLPSISTWKEGVVAIAHTVIVAYLTLQSVAGIMMLWHSSSCVHIVPFLYIAIIAMLPYAMAGHNSQKDSAKESSTTHVPSETTALSQNADSARSSTVTTSSPSTSSIFKSFYSFLITIGVVSLALSYYASYRHIQCDAPLGTWCYAAGLYNIIAGVALGI